MRNTFRNCRYALSNPAREWKGDYAVLNTGWTFADNVVDGGPWTQYGTRVYAVADSDFCYNRITTTDTEQGEAPDLGAHEYGRPPVHYGPRPDGGERGNSM